MFKVVRLLEVIVVNSYSVFCEDGKAKEKFKPLVS